MGVDGDEDPGRKRRRQEIILLVFTSPSEVLLRLDSRGGGQIIQSSWQHFETSMLHIRLAKILKRLLIKQKAV